MDDLITQAGCVCCSALLQGGSRRTERRLVQKWLECARSTGLVAHEHVGTETCLLRCLMPFGTTPWPHVRAAPAARLQLREVEDEGMEKLAGPGVLEGGLFC